MHDNTEAEKKEFHPIKSLRAQIEKHPRAAKVVGAVAIAATATLTTLAVLRSKRSDDDHCLDNTDSDSHCSDSPDDDSIYDLDPFVLFVHNDGRVERVV